MEGSLPKKFSTYRRIRTRNLLLKGLEPLPLRPISVGISANFLPCGISIKVLNGAVSIKKSDSNPDPYKFTKPQVTSSLRFSARHCSALSTLFAGMEQFSGQPRLPKFAAPKRYDIRLKPDLTACTFAGFVSIDVDVIADTRFIVLNAAQLSVNSDSVSFTARDSSKV